jgi:hypothetical protein
MEPLHACDQIFHLVEGWFFVVSGRVHGTFADDQSAWREMTQHQQAILDLHRRNGCRNN